MKKGFRLSLDKGILQQIEPPVFKHKKDGKLEALDSVQCLINEGYERTRSIGDEVYVSLADIILADGTVDGDYVLKNYFPTVKADVFISHSHDDADLAIAFSQWLYENFGITAFVDHTIWGSGDRLIKELDNRYCYQSDTKTYNYKTRNLTTSFVHLMLASAISKMIDSCECLIFLNTPQSLSANPKGNTTGSPWIFYELLMAKLLMEKRSTRQFSQGGSIQEGGRISFTVLQTPPTDFLSVLTVPILKKWKVYAPNDNPKRALEILYSLC